MSKRILTVRKIKELLRLRWALELSERQVSASLKVAHSTVGEYVKRAQRAGLDWTQVESMAEAELKDRLFPVKSIIAGNHFGRTGDIQNIQILENGKN